DRPSVANVSLIVTLDRGQLAERVGRVPQRKLELVLKGVDVVLGRYVCARHWGGGGTDRFARVRCCASLNLDANHFHRTCRQTCCPVSRHMNQRQDASVLPDAYCMIYDGRMIAMIA